MTVFGRALARGESSESCDTARNGAFELVLATPIIISPDTSHWAKWIDAATGEEPRRRERAQALHHRLMERGRIPLLSWHHLEELLGVGDHAAAIARIRFLQDLPLLGWLQLPNQVGPGAVTQILAAEAIAACEGAGNLVSVRDRARELLLRTGPGRRVIDSPEWVWEALRAALLSRRSSADLTSALGKLQTFDENQTIGEFAKAEVNSPQAMNAKLQTIYAHALGTALEATGGDDRRARSMADEFIRRVVQGLPAPGTTVRDLLVSRLVAQGLDEHEIQDSRLLAELTRLGVFRSQLRVVAAETGRSFTELKRVPMEVLPSWVIAEALRTHGQHRAKRPGSDLNDVHLGVLAAYCSVLYVDRRTAEDFRRAQAKEPRLAVLLGCIAKGADFDALLA